MLLVTFQHFNSHLILQLFIFILLWIPEKKCEQRQSKVFTVITFNFPTGWLFPPLYLNAASQHFESNKVFQRYVSVSFEVMWHGAGQRSALVFGFGEGAELFGVDVPQLLQLPLSSPVQILDVHHVRLLDPGVFPELVSDSGDEARFVPTGPEELPVQSQDLLLQLTVTRHREKLKFTRDKFLL